MPYSVEIAGGLRIANHNILVDVQNERFDIVNAETMSGNDNKPNPVWKNKTLWPIEYMVRFVGLYDKHEIDEVSRELSKSYCFENEKSRVRYIIFANEPNRHYANQGIKYITFEQIAQFIAEIRRQCWIESGIGVASVHYQWDMQINSVFAFANDFTMSLPDRVSDILDF